MNIPPELIEKVAKVNAAVDEANAKFENLEGLLKASGACITVWVKVDKYTTLGFTRFGKEFHICINKAGEGSAGEHRPWMDWDREVKLTTVKYLDALIVGIEDQFDRLLETVSGVTRFISTDTNNNPTFSEFANSLPPRCRKALFGLKVDSVEQLEAVDVNDFLMVKNVGTHTATEMKRCFLDAYKRELWPEWRQ